MPKLFLYRDGRAFYHVLSGELYAEYPWPVAETPTDLLHVTQWVEDRARMSGYAVEIAGV